MQVWLKTRITQEGDLLHARTYMVAGGDPQIFNATVDLGPVRKALLKRASRQNVVSGWPVVSDSWNWAERQANKLGRNKLVRAVAKGARAVVKSKYTGMAVASIQAFPPVGVPALAAYGAANAGLFQIDAGQKAYKWLAKKSEGLGIKDAKKAVRASKLPKATKAKLIKELDRKAKLTKKVSAKAKRLRGELKKVDGMIKNPNIPQGLKASQHKRRKEIVKWLRGYNDLLRRDTAKKSKRIKSLSDLVKRPGTREWEAVKAIRKGKKAKDAVQRIARAAKYSRNRLKRMKAKKAARILGIAMAGRIRRARIALNLKGSKGLVIDHAGGLHSGVFKALALRRGQSPNLMLLKGGKVKQGNFKLLKGKR